jgi:hypothetical protein
MDGRVGVGRRPGSATLQDRHGHRICTFIYSARREEANMLQLFPEQYAAYVARTGMLVPRLFGRR